MIIWPTTLRVFWRQVGLAAEFALAYGVSADGTSLMENYEEGINE